MPILLLGLTTTWGSDWRDKVQEISKFNIDEIALFATGIEKVERTELYHLLESTDLKNIHHTHLREQDMSSDEIDYLIKRYNCKLFNLHPTEKGLKRLSTDLKKYREMIFVENTGRTMNQKIDLFEQMAKNCGGLCADFSHWQDYGILQKQPGYANFFELARKYKIGCAHISAIMDSPNTPVKGIDTPHDYNRHTYTNLSQFDYLKQFTAYLPKYTSLELENSFAQQLKAKKYIETLIR